MHRLEVTTLFFFGFYLLTFLLQELLLISFCFSYVLFCFFFLNYLLPFLLQELLLIFYGLVFGTGYSNNGGAEGDGALPM